MVMTGCAPQYRGFSEIPLGDNRYQIDVDRHGAFVNEQKTREIALVRAAELTLQNGFTSFSVDELESDASRTVIGQTPVNCNTTVLPRTLGPLIVPSQARTRCTGGADRTRHDYSAAMVITMSNGAPAALDARQVLAQYGQRVGYEGPYSARPQPAGDIGPSPEMSPTVVTAPASIAPVTTTRPGGGAPTRAAVIDPTHVAACRRLVESDIAAGIDTGGVSVASCTSDARLSPDAIAECNRHIGLIPLPDDLAAFGYVSISCAENGKLVVTNRYGQTMAGPLPYWMYPPGS